jgi:L,D-peptidoglycan transpeptidase YkuD (ErfK/YbiS/YcfS/YnhG family)
MRLLVEPEGWLTADNRRLRCALGRGGIQNHKIEGDGATPAGCFPLRQLLYRPDRVIAPDCRLPLTALRPEDGWCDDPAHPDYNRAVRLPHPARCETLWREDQIYDLIIPLGYNDDPPLAGRGSAIFLHLARPDYSPTEGCVALSLDDLRWLLGRIRRETVIDIALRPIAEA